MHISVKVPSEAALLIEAAVGVEHVEAYTLVEL